MLLCIDEDIIDGIIVGVLIIGVIVGLRFLLVVLLVGGIAFEFW